MPPEVAGENNQLAGKVGAAGAARALPAWLAPIVQELERDQKVLVRAGDVRHARPELLPGAARVALAQLVRLGWLHPTGHRGTYEFMPGAAAGRYPSGDPWLMLRAELAVCAGRFHVGATSAAWLRGYMQRTPTTHVVVTAPGIRVPRALKDVYRVLATEPAPCHGEVNGLPVPTPAELFAEVAHLAPRLSLDGAAGWLRRLLQEAPPEEIADVLRDRSPTTRARAGFLAESCSAEAHERAIAALGEPNRGPFYSGPAHRAGRFSSRWRVYDTGQIA